MKTQFNLSNDVISRSTDSAFKRFIEVHGKVNRDSIQKHHNVENHCLSYSTLKILRNNFEGAVKEFDLPELKDEDMADV